MGICEYCKIEFELSKYNPNQKFCSRLCWERSKRIERNAKRVKIYRNKREEVIELLGNKCILCGIDDYMVLTLDHINDDPENDPFRNGIPRQKHNKATRLIYWILQNPDNAKERLQILCWNCNNLKRYYRDEYNKRLNSKT